ncbi:MAG: hypothetical protein Q9196_003644 [Gyalolechia fulgens]
MEVFISNLSNQSTERQLKQWFKPILARLNIHVFSCQKPRNRNFATLTIGDVQLGQRFLDLHGQTNPGRDGFKTVKEKLYHYNRPVSCSKSRNGPDKFLLQSLEQEVNEKSLAKHRHQPRPSKTGGQRNRRKFQCSLTAVGSMDYSGSDLVLVDHYHMVRAGSIFFGRRSALFQSGREVDQQMEVPYNSIQSLILGNSTDPLLTFSLTEGPRFFGKEPHVEDNLAHAMHRLSIQPAHGYGKPSERRRIVGFDPKHQALAASSFAYSFLVDPQDIQAILALKPLPGFPEIVKWHVGFVTNPAFPTQMSQLNTALSLARYRNFPFEVKFQLQRLAQNGYLSPSGVLQLMQAVKIPFVDADKSSLAAAIRRTSNQIPFAGPGTEPSDLSLDTVQQLLIDNYHQILREEEYSRDVTQHYEHIASIYKATVTPLGIHLSGPEAEVKNRVLRQYSAFSNYFLQVSFLDEDGEPLRHHHGISLTTIYHERFKKILGGNITVCGRPYEVSAYPQTGLKLLTDPKFLGFSHSSLRSHTCWFMAPFTWNGQLRHAGSVIKDLGDFSAIRSPAKCAARIGQAFSQAFSSVDIPKEAFRSLPEIDRLDAHGIRRTFSDGGMISLDNRLHGDVLCLRPSMIKFEAKSTQIEICGAGFKPLPFYLNRQLIKILEDLGVPEQSFLDLQDEAVEQLRITAENPINAGYYLQRNLVGKSARLPWLIRKLSYIGMSFGDDSFLRDTHELAILIQLRELKYRSRIFVERIMDETDYLEEGQIYCSVENERTGLVLTGRVVITRCPALHPGDVQYVDAVDVPRDSPLRSVRNCVVFSSKGDRDLPSQLSGGDLDGDLYNIIYDDDLMPTHLSDPADYPTAPAIDIGREVTRSDMTDFFVQFMENDQLGRLSTLHQTLADQKPEGVFHPDCILLAEMCSTAVDFSKTGIPVKLERMPKSSNVRPDFQAPGPRVLIEENIKLEDLEVPEDDEDEDEPEETARAPRYYRSEKVLGKLYRAIDEQDFFSEIQRQSRSPSNAQSLGLADKVWEYVREKAALIQYVHYLDFARDVKEAYEDNMIDTMLENSSHPTHFVSEVEVFAGALIGKDGAQSKRQREYSTTMKEKHDRDVAYTVQCILQGEEQDSSKEEALERSIACLDVAIHEPRIRRRFGRLVSFTWVAAAVCLKEIEKFTRS